MFSLVRKIYSFIPVKARFPLWVITAVLSFYLLGSVNSAFADEYNLGTAYGIVGAVLGVFVIMSAITAFSENEPSE